MTPCSSCGRHHRNDPATCPHCDAPLGGSVRRTAAAVAMGLALTACSGDDTGKTTPTSIAAIDYGSGILGTDTDTDADTDPSGDTGASSGTGRTP